jgi:integrase
MPEELHEHSIEALMPGFLLHLEVECRFAKESLVKYRDCMRQVERVYGYGPVTSFTKNNLMELKAHLMGRNLSVNRQVSVLLILKRFLKHVAEDCNLSALPSEAVIIPRRPRREVAYLSAEEVQRFVDSIKLTSGGGAVYMPGLRFRALVEGGRAKLEEDLEDLRVGIELQKAKNELDGAKADPELLELQKRARRLELSLEIARSEKAMADLNKPDPPPPPQPLSGKEVRERKKVTLAAREKEVREAIQRTKDDPTFDEEQKQRMLNNLDEKLAEIHGEQADLL